MRSLLGFLRDEPGATAIEYNLIASLIAVVIIAAASSLGVRLRGTFSHIVANLS